MRVKIHGGTVAHGDAPLCHTCRYATIVTGPGLRDQIIECQELAFGRQRITFPVHSCTGYSDRRHASLREMEDLAWVLRSDPRRNQIGFVPASKLRERERYVLDDE